MQPSFELVNFVQKVFTSQVEVTIIFILSRIFNAISLPLCAVTSNTWQLIYSFSVVCILAKVHPTILLFRVFFSFNKHHFFSFGKHHCYHGRWFAYPRKGQHPLIRGTPSSIHHWKKQFFFVKQPNISNWGFM